MIRLSCFRFLFRFFLLPCPNYASSVFQSCGFDTERSTLLYVRTRVRSNTFHLPVLVFRERPHAAPTVARRLARFGRDKGSSEENFRGIRIVGTARFRRPIGSGRKSLSPSVVRKAEEVISGCGKRSDGNFNSCASRVEPFNKYTSSAMNVDAHRIPLNIHLSFTTRLP